MALPLFPNSYFIVILRSAETPQYPHTLTHSRSTADRIAAYLYVLQEAAERGIRVFPLTRQHVVHEPAGNHPPPGGHRLQPGQSPAGVQHQRVPGMLQQSSSSSFLSTPLTCRLQMGGCCLLRSVLS